MQSLTRIDKTALDTFAVMRQVRAINRGENCDVQRMIEMEQWITSRSRPADRVTIGNEVAMMLSAFPVSNAPDPKAYAKIMVQRIAARRPSLIALESTCAKIIDTMTFPPPIAEVLAILEKEQEAWSSCASSLRIAVGLEQEIPF
jgi:Tfp pilus assembly protein FimV